MPLAEPPHGEKPTAKTSVWPLTFPVSVPTPGRSATTLQPVWKSVTSSVFVPHESVNVPAYCPVSGTHEDGCVGVSVLPQLARTAAAARAATAAASRPALTRPCPPRAAARRSTVPTQSFAR